MATSLKIGTVFTVRGVARYAPAYCAVIFARIYFWRALAGG